MKYKWLYFSLSGLVIIPGLVSLFLFKLKPSIDFTGGSRWEINLSQAASPEDLKKIVAARSINIDSVVSSGSNRFLIKTNFIEEKKRGEIRAEIEKQFGKVSELRFESVGPLLGRELLAKTIAALVMAALLILVYIAWQFKNWSFGFCATLATLHDTLVVLGSFSLLGHFFGFEADLLFVTALLTILSFSVHDTIVVYDRIRESVRKFPGLSFVDLTNKAVNETLVRSLNNSLVVVFMLLSLALLGGETIRHFVIALLVGTVSGTYSSIFTAAPLLVILKERSSRRSS